MTTAQISLLSEVAQAMKLILIMPAANTTSERSFSTLRRIKTYLHSTMGQQRLNHLMVLHVHKDITDEIPLKEIADEFIGDSEHNTNIWKKQVTVIINVYL